MNIKKIVSYVVVSVFVLSISGFIASKTEAAVVFPNGCASAIGYSVVNGSPCNSTSIATLPIQGCASPLGYSVTNGAICSGASEAITFLGGCASMYGYSTANGSPCNGTAVASIYYDTTTPGLPTTGASALSLGNMLLLLSSGLLTIGAVIYALRRAKTV